MTPRIEPRRLPDRSALSPRSARGRRAHGATLCLLLGTLTLAACNDTPTPADPTPEPNAWDMSATTLRFPLETSTGSTSAFELVATNIQWAPGSGILTADVAVRNNDQADTLRGPTTVWVFDFDPEDVVPLNAVCGIVPGPCWYDYEGAHGEDGLLAPGETSEPLTWEILNITGSGFRFRTRLEGLPDRGGRIAGVAFHDLNRNGRRENNEPGIAGVAVHFKTVDRPAYVLTDARGHYELRAEQPGLYTVLAAAPPGWNATTSTEQQVVVLRRPDGTLSDYLSADFGFASTRPPGIGIGGAVFLDGDRNGLRNPNEVGIENVPIHVTPFPPAEHLGIPCSVPVIVRTDSRGRWFVPEADLPCGPPWLIQRGPHPGTLSIPLPPLLGLYGTTPRDQVVHGFPVPAEPIVVDFGVAPADNSDPEPILVIEGIVFVDHNGNGVQDLGESPGPGVRLEALSPCDRLETTWTDVGGYYRFEPPMTGWCPIGGVAVSTAWETTTDNPILFPTPTTPGVHVIRADFGVLPQDIVPAPPH